MIKGSSYNKFQVIKWVMFAIMGILIAAVFVFAEMSCNTVAESREEGSYVVVENMTVTQSGNASNIKNEFKFKLENINHSETMCFFIDHHNVQVYIENECVYTFTAATDDVFLTSGGHWVKVPLYESDKGKEVCVILTPLYKNYQMMSPKIFLGSETAIHSAMVHSALPVLILSICIVFIGFLLLLLAVFHSIKKMFTGKLYALGFMAISAGLWRICYDKVSYILMPDYSVFIYTVSIVLLMGIALSMLNLLQVSKKGKKIIHICSYIYCTVYIFQLILQIAGVADLRQTLKCIHITIIISAMAFLLDGISQLITKNKKENYSWILGAGAVIDLLIYYFAKTSVNMVFTLIAILFYSVIEGIKLLFTYIKHKNVLEEMKTQLTLSRTTTMMSQIRSHFVFNILNAISGLCKYDPEKADETVVLFARYLRNNINVMEKDDNIPFATDLKQLEDYVALEQVRFGDKIKFYTDIETDSFFIPPLILQPVVENAIKHGVSKKQGKGAITLRTRDAGKNIIITVEDDGVGFEMSELKKQESVGIKNIRFRLEHIVNGTLDIKSKPNVGTTVTITIPKMGGRP